LNNFYSKKLGSKGQVVTVLVFILLAMILVYFFFSKGKENQAVEMSDFRYEGLLDLNTVSLNTIPLLNTGSIKLGENESRDFKTENFLVSVRRGKNIKIGSEEMSCYIFESKDENNPTVASQFFVIGLTGEAGITNYHIVSVRNKSLKGI
jgi:hypothetical protein